MQFALSDKKTIEGDKLCSITHNGVELLWVVSYFIKNPSSKAVAATDDMVVAKEDLFKYTNMWLDKLSGNQQTILFNLYKQARNTLTNVSTHDDLVVSLRKTVAQILDFQSFKNVHSWMTVYTGILCPHSVKEFFVEDSAGRNKLTKTYVRSEYQELVTLTFLFRLLFPIFGEFLAVISAYTDSVSKEFITLNLINNSAVKQSNAMLRLVSFIENTIPADTNRSPALIDEISTEDYIPWLLSQVIMRRLMIGALQDTGDGATLVSFIYGYTRQRATNDASFGGYIKDKKHPNSASTDQNELSSWEEWRVKEPFSMGDIAIVQVALEDPVKLYWQLCIGLDEEESNKFAPDPDNVNDEFKSLMSEPIARGQLGMLKYVVSPLVSHRLLVYVERAEIYSAMIAGAAYLKRLGLMEAAILMTAYKRSSKIMLASDDDNASRVTEEQTAELHAIYPYVRKSKSKHVVVETKTSFDVAIAAFENEFKRAQWHITLPHEDIVKFTGGLKITRTYACPTDIKPLLVTFFLAMDAAAKRIQKHRKLFLATLENY